MTLSRARTLCVLIVSTALLTHQATAFLNAASPKEAISNPALPTLAKAPTGVLLDVRLDVGSNANSHLSLQGLELELSPESASHDKLRPPLPGADGPRPNDSAGAKKITIKNQAYFVDMSGKQHVPLTHGCWEMVWYYNAPAGVIVCGFNLEETVHRNDASLEKGRIYMTFPVWTRRTLEHEQAYRLDVEARAEKHAQERFDAFKKMDETNNPIKKAMHFRHAAHARELLDVLPVEYALQIPHDSQVMELGTNIMITTKGTMWRKEESSSSLFGMPNIHHTLLGTVTLRAGAPVVANSTLKP